MPGLEKAFIECFPRAKTQRYVVHKLRNIASKLSRKIRKDCLDHVKRVFYTDSNEEGLERFKDWKKYWEKVVLGAVQCLEKDIESVL